MNEAPPTLADVLAQLLADEAAHRKSIGDVVIPVATMLLHGQPGWARGERIVLALTLPY